MSDWRVLAACRNEDPELFFPSGDDQAPEAKVAAAREVCDGCPVQEHCRIWALTHPKLAEFGVWGRLSQADRKIVRNAVIVPTPTKPQPTKHGGRPRMDLAEVRWLRDGGMSDYEIARKLGVEPEAIERAECREAAEQRAVAS